MTIGRVRRFFSLVVVGGAIALSASSAHARFVCRDVFRYTAGQPIERPQAILISAPSGTGKSTLINMLMQEFPNTFQLGLSTTLTTRAPRPGEVNGRDYTFVTAEEFQRRDAAGEFIETNQFAGNSYGTSRVRIAELLQTGRVLILDKEVNGAAAIRRALGTQQASIFIRPPSIQVLRERLQARGTETPERIDQRVSRAASELARESEYDFVVVNDQLVTAYSDLKRVLAPWLPARD